MCNTTVNFQIVIGGRIKANRQLIELIAADPQPPQRGRSLPLVDQGGARAVRLLHRRQAQLPRVAQGGGRVLHEDAL